MTLLIVSDDLPSAQVAALALTAAGETVLATVPCANLVREVVRLAPQTVIAVVAGEGPGQCSALLASLLPSAQAAAQAAAAVTIQAFEASLGALEQSPLATAAIRAALVQARTQWQALLDGLRRAAGPMSPPGGPHWPCKATACLSLSSNSPRSMSTAIRC